jgi:hypothetical protein
MAWSSGFDFTLAKQQLIFAPVQNCKSLRSCMNFRSKLIFTFTILVCAGCGGGGGSDDKKTLSLLVGNWSGVITLLENSCEREIPVEAETLTFQHGVSATLVIPGQADVTLVDGAMVCRALRVNPESDVFEAVCPDHPLPGFSPGLTCFEQRVWNYKLSSDRPVFADIVRTAYVHCSDNADIAFACPVTYSGLASRND